IPNLRRNASLYIRHRLGRIIGLRGSQASATPREARIYWLYGLLAGTYSVWLIGFILLSLGGFLTRRYQGWGAVLFATLLLIIFRNPIRNASRSLASLFLGKQAIIVRMKRL